MELKDIIKQGLASIDEAKDLKTLEEVRISLLSKKGHLTSVMRQMKDLAQEDRPAFGAAVNEAKTKIEAELKTRYEDLKDARLLETMKADAIDISLPGTSLKLGKQNPLILIVREMEQFFQEMGYQVVEGDELELDLYNFERANIPKDHPAREMQDSFYITNELLLRTHTSPVQARTMRALEGTEPIRMICPGKVYRRDNDDATHSHQFTQIEGLFVDKHVRMSDLKGTLDVFAKKMFGEDREIRLRPSFFPFTEPSAEMDISCKSCAGKGCSVCKQSGWIEILGSGMIHPRVLEMAGYDPNIYSGFAFGMGPDRIAMLKYGIDDIRQFYTNDVRFLKQFDEA